MLRQAIHKIFPDLKHYARTHGPGPDRRLATLIRAMTEEGDAFLISSVLPAGRGKLAQRISLHLTDPTSHTPIATHIEALQEDGRWARFHGYYYGPGEQVEAVDSYLARCSKLGVDPLNLEGLTCEYD